MVGSGCAGRTLSQSSASGRPRDTMLRTCCGTACNFVSVAQRATSWRETQGLLALSHTLWVRVSATWYHSVAVRWKVSSSSCGGCVSDVEGASRAVGGSGTLSLNGVAALRCTAVMWFFRTARAASKELPTYSSFCTVVNDSQSASTMASKLVRPAVTSDLAGRNGPMGRVSPRFCGRRQRTSTPRDPQPCP